MKDRAVIKRRNVRPSREPLGSHLLVIGVEFLLTSNSFVNSFHSTTV
jgi:hypothetical protein